MNFHLEFVFFIYRGYSSCNKLVILSTENIVLLFLELFLQRNFVSNQHHKLYSSFELYQIHTKFQQVDV